MEMGQLHPLGPVVNCTHCHLIASHSNVCALDRLKSGWAELPLRVVLREVGPRVHSWAVEGAR